MPQKILVVTPLQEEYDDLYHSLSALNLKSHAEKIGSLAINVTPSAASTVKTNQVLGTAICISGLQNCAQAKTAM